MPKGDYTQLRKLGQGSFGSVYLVMGWEVRGLRGEQGAQRLCVYTSSKKGNGKGGVGIHSTFSANSTNNPIACRSRVRRTTTCM